MDANAIITNMDIYPQYTIKNGTQGNLEANKAIKKKSNTKNKDK
jgi:hypothetical protein